MRLLHECADARGLYEDLIATYAVQRDVPTKEAWFSKASELLI